MARHVIKQRITLVDDLRDFDDQGYRYSTERSTADKLVFLRYAPLE